MDDLETLQGGDLEQEHLYREFKKSRPCGSGFAAAAVRLEALLWPERIIYSTEF